VGRGRVTKRFDSTALDTQRRAKEWIYSDQQGDRVDALGLRHDLDLDYDRLQMLSMTREGRRQILKKGTK
jgi:hypothetical protein